jgi:hypothetical protein
MVLLRCAAAALQEHVLRFCWHDVPRRHVLDSPTYKYQLSLYVKGVLVCAGSIFAYDSLLGAMVMDMLRQAGSGQPLNFRCYGLRWQVGFACGVCCCHSGCVFMYACTPPAAPA